MATLLRGDARLAVWMPRWLGDCVMAEPVLAELRRRFGARLTILAPRAFWDVLGFGADAEGDGATGALGAASHWVPAGDVAAVEEALRGADAVLLLRGSLRSAWRAWRAGVRQRIGFARDGRGALLTDAMVPARRSVAIPFGLGMPPGRFRVAHHGGPDTVGGQFKERFGSRIGKRRFLVRPFGDDVVELAAMVGVRVERVAPRVPVRADWAARVDARLAAWGLGRDVRFTLVNVGGRADSAKAYPNWGAVVRALVAAGERVVLVTGPGEEARCDQVAPDPHVHVWADPTCTLGELAALGARARVALTTDGGPRHVLAAAGARLIVLFGPTSPHHTAAHLQRTRSLIGHAPCAPCHRETCHHTPALACFAAIDPKELVAAALS